MERQPAGAVAYRVGEREGDKELGRLKRQQDDPPRGNAAGERAIKLLAQHFLNRSGGIRVLCELGQKGDMVLEGDGWHPLVVGLVAMGVAHDRGEKWVLLNASLQRLKEGLGTVERRAKVVDGGDDDGVVEAEVLAADCAQLIGALVVSAAGDG